MKTSNKDQTSGVGILIVSIAGIIIYGWLLFFIAPQIVLQITAFITLAAILGIMSWIGYTMATTPPPAPIEAELPSSIPEVIQPAPSQQDERTK